MESRQSSGILLVPLVSKLDDGTYTIEGKNYKITSDGCSCPDYLNRGVTCKHMWAVMSYIESKKVPVIKFQELITFMKSRDGIVPDIELFKKFGTLVDEASENKVISKSGKVQILMGGDYEKF